MGEGGGWRKEGAGGAWVGESQTRDNNRKKGNAGLPRSQTPGEIKVRLRNLQEMS